MHCTVYIQLLLSPRLWIFSKCSSEDRRVQVCKITAVNVPVCSVSFACNWQEPQPSQIAIAEDWYVRHCQTQLTSFHMWTDWSGLEQQPSSHTVQACDCCWGLYLGCHHNCWHPASSNSGYIWVSPVGEGWKTLTVGHRLKVISRIQEKTVARNFCSFSSEALQQL